MSDVQSDDYKDSVVYNIKGINICNLVINGKIVIRFTLMHLIICIVVNMQVVP
jgi:hypothetical protein